MSRCKGCRAELRWARTEGGRKIPLDERPLRREEVVGPVFVLREIGHHDGPLAIASTPMAFPEEANYKRHDCKAYRDRATR